MRWDWYGFNLKIVLLTLTVSLFILFGSHWAYKNFGYHQPLIQALEEEAAVQSFEIDGNLPVLRVVVYLEPTENLMETYRELDRRVAGSVRGDRYQLVVKDSRDAKLDEAFYRSQFAIHQAIMQGNFQDMAAVIEANARAAGAEAQVFVDHDHVYVQMKGTEHHLATVVPRSQPTEQQLPSGSGGGLYVQRG